MEKASFGLNGSTLTNIKLDEGGSIVGEVTAFTTFEDARRGQLTKVIVKDARINPLTVGPVRNTPASENGINLYARQIDFQNAVIDLTTPYGPLPVMLNGTIIDKGDEYQLSAMVEAKAEIAEIVGQLTATMAKATRKISAHLELAEGKATLPDIELRRLAGWISADIERGAGMPVMNAQLTAGSLKLYQLPLQGTTFSASSAPGKAQVLLTGQIQEESGDINADVTLEGDKLSAKIDANLKNLDALNLADMTGEGSFNLLASGEKETGRPLGELSAWKNLAGNVSVNARKLSLPGLVTGAAASGKAEMNYDPAVKLLTVKTLEGPFTFKGTVKALNAKPVTLGVTNGAAAWNNEQKSLKLILTDAEASGASFSLEKAATDLTLWFGGDAPVAEGKLNIGEITHLATPAYFIPLRLSMQFASLSSEQYATGFTGEISEKNGLLYAKFQGRHNTAANKGGIDVSMPPIKLIQGVTTLAQVFPISSVYMSDAFGTAGLSLKASWQKPAAKWQTTTSGELYLKDFTATHDTTTVTNVNTVLKLDSLTPPVFKNQTISIGELFVGLPLTNGVMDASLDDKKNLAVSKADWELAGGKLSSSPFTLPLDTLSTQATLTATGLDLAQFFSIAPTEGLVATGKVNGSIPLTVSKDSIVINNGVLETEGVGTISYAVNAMPAFLRDATNAQVLDLRTALTDFHYDSLRMVLNGEAGGEQKIQLHVKGKNPAFYEGKPVDFNLNLEGPLQTVQKYKPGGKHIPDSIRTQLENYEKQHGK